MRAKWAAFIVVLILVCSSMPARAGVIFQTTLLDSIQGDFGVTSSTPAYYIHNVSIEDLREAVRFTVPSDSAYGNLTADVFVAARFNSSQRVQVSLHADNQNSPGAVLSSVILSDLPVRPDGTQDATYVAQSVAFGDAPQLQPGGNYWLALSQPDLGNLTDVYWFLNRTNQTGTVAMLSSPLNGTAWFVGTGQSLPRLTIRATAVPEPGTAMLALAAIPLLKSCRGRCGRYARRRCCRR